MRFFVEQVARSRRDPRRHCHDCGICCGPQLVARRVLAKGSRRPCRRQDTATVPGTDDTVLARGMATVGRGRAHMQVARPISSDIRRKSPMVRVLQHQDRRSIAILSGSRRASSFWLTTVPHAPKSSRQTSPKRPGGPIATCRRPRHLLSPKAQAQGNDGPALGFAGKDVWTALGSIAIVAILAVFLNAILLRFVWLMVGGKASTRTFFTISGYNGFALISLAVVEIIGVGVYKTVDPTLYESIRKATSKGEPIPKVPLDDWMVSVPYLLGLLLLLVWIFIAWGAFR
jgi:hypothetical protein